MNHGEVVEIANSDELYAHPQHDYTKRLLQAIPKGFSTFRKRKVMSLKALLSAFYLVYRINTYKIRDVKVQYFIPAMCANFKPLTLAPIAATSVACGRL